MAMTDEELFLASMGDVTPLAKDNQTLFYDSRVTVRHS